MGWQCALAMILWRWELNIWGGSVLKLRNFRTSLAAIAVIFFAWAGPSTADERLATISVTGQGTVVRSPDMASISVGVETAGASAGAAVAANSDAAAKIIIAAKAAGIDRADIQTRSFTVQPRYEQRQQVEAGSAPKITGYVVVNELALTCRNLMKLGALLDTLIGKGANRINAIRFELADESGARAEARTAAIANAREKARTYADAAGVKLGNILSISEGGGAVPRPPMAAEMRMAASAVPIEGGSTAVRASVMVVWEIDDD